MTSNNSRLDGNAQQIEYLTFPNKSISQMISLISTFASIWIPARNRSSTILVGHYTYISMLDRLNSFSHVMNQSIDLLMWPCNQQTSRGQLITAVIKNLMIWPVFPIGGYLSDVYHNKWEYKWGVSSCLWLIQLLLRSNWT